MQLLIPVSVLFFALNSIMTRLFQQKFPASENYIGLYQALFCFFAAGAFFCSAGLKFIISAPLVTGGILFGVLFFVSVRCAGF